MSPAQAMVEVKEENYHDCFTMSDVKTTRIHETTSTVSGKNQELHDDLDKDIVDSEKALDCDCNLDGVGDEVIDILENADTGMGFSPSDGATECSSSFSDTDSSSESSIRNSADAEIESQYLCDNDVSRLFMRKKTLTTDWEKYRRPLMWRCHWLELRIKELQSQASKYDRQLLEIEHRRQLKYSQASLDGSAARVIPFSRLCFETKIKKRRKRKRIEDMVDIQAHVSAHPLFSYYEKKKVDADGIDDDCSSLPVVIEEPNYSTEDFGVNSDWTSFEWKDSESFPENALWKIEGLQSRILKLKNQLNKLVLKNAAKASLVENSSHCVAEEPVARSLQSPPLSPAHGEAKLVEGLYAPCQQLSDYEAGGLLFPCSAVSSYADHTMLDLDDTGKCLFSLADMPLDHAPMCDSCENIFDEVLIDNQAAEEGLQNYEVCLPVEKTCQGKEENGRNSVVPAVSVQPYGRKVEEENHSALAPTPESSVLELCLLSDVHVPKNRRNRVGRRVPSSVWNAENSVSGTDQDN